MFIFSISILVGIIAANWVNEDQKEKARLREAEFANANWKDVKLAEMKNNQIRMKKELEIRNRKIEKMCRRGQAKVLDTIDPIAPMKE